MVQHAEWIYDNAGDNPKTCSHCGIKQWISCSEGGSVRFCTNCGYEMSDKIHLQSDTFTLCSEGKKEE